MQDSLLFRAIKSIEISLKNYYDALLFIVNNHLLFVTDRKYKDFMKNWQLSVYFCLKAESFLIFARVMVIEQPKHYIYLLNSD